MRWPNGDASCILHFRQFSKRRTLTQLRPLTEDEILAREAGLDMAARLAGAARPLSVAYVQALYDVLLIEQAGDEALIALGLAFGEQIVAASDFEWARVSDEYGDETCVAVRGKEIFCAPISMIQRRIRRQERLDISSLRDETIAIIRKRIAEGKATDR
jgi:hypothetical protein